MKTKNLLPCLLVSIMILSGFGLNAQVKSPIESGKEKLQMYQSHEEMRESSTFKDLHWQFIGPTNISGRCTDVEAVGPKGQNYTIWVATASSGVWKSINEGVSFEPVFEHQGTSTIGDLAIAPSNPEIVWVGSGEANIFRSSNPGCGVWKTSDGGESWTHMGLEETFTISRILVHPENPDIVYVAASGHEWTQNKERGLYKTIDGGESWEKILYKGPESGVNDLVMDQGNPEVLYATTWQRTRLKWNDPRTYESHKDNGIWKTTNGGKNWKMIRSGKVPVRWVSRLVASKFDLATVYMTQTGRRDDDFQVYIWKSENFGRTWTDISGNIPVGPVNVIREDSENKKRLYLGTDAGVYISNDGGKKWEVLGDMPFAYVHDLAYHPRDNMIIIATHGRGIWVLDAEQIDKKEESGGKAGITASQEQVKNLLGNWLIESDRGFSFNLTFMKKGESVTGKMSMQFGNAELSNIFYDGNKLMFKAVLDMTKMGGQVIEMKCDADIKGEAIEGVVKSKMGNLKIKGKKEKK